jgi:hypothetical protein
VVPEKEPLRPAREGLSLNLGMHATEESDWLIVCAEQRIVQEGWSPSDARVRSVISERGSNVSGAEEGGRYGEA